MRTAALSIGMMLVSSSALADRGRFNLRLEPAVAIFLAKPQSEKYGVGGEFTGRLEFSPRPFIGLELGAGVLQFSEAESEAGAQAFAFTIGGRLRPLDDTTWEERARRDGSTLESGLWIGADGGLAETNDLVRTILSAGVGLDVSVVGPLSLGPFVRYQHVLQPDDEPSPEDAKILLIGVAGIIGLAEVVHVEAHVEVAPPPPPEPPPPPADTDGDGIPDPTDACPQEPEDMDGFEDANGCPDPDNDGDGILDAADRCVNEPETRNGFEDDDGCPDTPPVRVEQSQIVIVDQINFDLDSANLTPGSSPILDRIAELLVAHPEIQKIRIEGHTDESGSNARNMGLSRRRADAVRTYLVGKGIDRSRMETVGLGRTRPLDTSGTPEAMARNRRVEFHIVTTAPTVPPPP
jgi:outer membrane protein OmpA-like peptidoglycan-associated protein